MGAGCLHPPPAVPSASHITSATAPSGLATEQECPMADAFDMRHKSRTLVDGPDRAAARSYFHSVGYDRDDLKQPLIMVAHEWIGTMPCNFSQRALAQQV